MIRRRYFPNQLSISLVHYLILFILLLELFQFLVQLLIALYVEEFASLGSFKLSIYKTRQCLFVYHLILFHSIFFHRLLWQLWRFIFHYHLIWPLLSLLMLHDVCQVLLHSCPSLLFDNYFLSWRRILPFRTSRPLVVLQSLIA